MQTAELSAQMRSWAVEFSGIATEPVQVPERFWPFLAQRLSELGVAAEDQDVITVRIGANWRKVRITGKRGVHLRYEFADGSVGGGLVDIRTVHPESRARLTDIIERMLKDGRIAG